MTIKYLLNTSTNKALSLRYGEGMRSKIQLAPGKAIPCPQAMTKGLLASYLNLFKGDLRIVTEIPKEVNDEENTQENTITNKVPQEEDQTQNGTKSDNDESNDESGNSTGDTPGEGDQENEGDVDDESNDEGNNGGSGDASGDEVGSAVGPDKPARENAGTVSESGEGDQDNIPLDGDQGPKINVVEKEGKFFIVGDDFQEGPFDTKEEADETLAKYAKEEETRAMKKKLKGMNPDEVKAFAKELGIDFEDDITKKALIAVILSKGE